MIRKQIYITEENEAFLKQLASQRGVNEAEIVREALEQMRENIAETDRRTAAWADIEAAIAEINAAGDGKGSAYTWKRDDAYEDSRLEWQPLKVAEDATEYRAEGS